MLFGRHHPELRQPLPQMMNRARQEDKYGTSLDYTPPCNNGGPRGSLNREIQILSECPLNTPETHFLPGQLGEFEHPKAEIKILHVIDGGYRSNDHRIEAGFNRFTLKLGIISSMALSQSTHMTTLVSVF